MGGQFTSVNGVAANNIFRIHNGTYQALGSSPNDGVNGPVHAIAIDGYGKVHVGGAFTPAGGSATSANIAGWSSDTWTCPGNGTDAPVTALAVEGSSWVV